MPSFSHVKVICTDESFQGICYSESVMLPLALQMLLSCSSCLTVHVRGYACGDVVLWFTKLIFKNPVRLSVIPGKVLSSSFFYLSSAVWVLLFSLVKKKCVCERVCVSVCNFQHTASKTCMGFCKRHRLSFCTVFWFFQFLLLELPAVSDTTPGLWWLPKTKKYFAVHLSSNSSIGHTLLIGTNK